MLCANIQDRLSICGCYIEFEYVQKNHLDHEKEDKKKKSIPRSVLITFGLAPYGCKVPTGFPLDKCVLIPDDIA